MLLVHLYVEFEKQTKTKNPTNQRKKKKTQTENRLVVAIKMGWGVGKMGEEGQKVQTSSYKINKSWGYNVQHGDYS